MNFSSYYQQTPIMRRILEYLGDAVYVKGSDLDPNSDKKFRRYNDIIHAMADGFDVYRSNLDFKSLVQVIDVEYGNKRFPGEIFHNPLETFQKIDPTRDNINSLFQKNKIDNIEIMTGQGYNFAFQVPRDSPSYDALVKIGVKNRVLPWTAAKKLLGKQERYGNIPLLKDHIASTAFGRINDYIFDLIRNNSDLLMRTSDVFDENEISIFDTTQHGYLLNRRAFRIAFSLHQKTRTNDKYGYHGPPIVTLPTSGTTLEDRFRIRKDERDNYREAVEFAREMDVPIPRADLTSLITNYLISPTFDRHREHADNLGYQEIDSVEKETLYEKLHDEIPEMKPKDVFWDIPSTANWDLFKTKDLNKEVWRLFGNPNDSLLNPGALRYVIKEMKEKDIEDRDIIAAIAQKYREDHNWTGDLWKNDELLRAEYWVRTLGTQM